MRQVRTEEFVFYHGTGAAAARAILQSGSRDSIFEETGARALGREIRQALLAHANLSSNEDTRLHLLTGPGIEFSSLWVPALRQIDNPDDRSLFEYGRFFATLNIANAYRYAIGNPYRSEFILTLAESLKLLRHLGHALPLSVPTRFPTVDHAINNPSPPVVLELRGISRERLTTERGGKEIEGELRMFLEDGAHADVNLPGSFRIRDVTARDVAAVHDLSDWPCHEVPDPPWRPDDLKIAEVRRTVQDWLTAPIK